jgi:pilus assembly protein CpaC
MATTRKLMHGSIALLLLTLTAFAVPAHAEVPALDVEIDRGVTVQLGAPAVSVFIANPEVADIQVLSPTNVMVFGKKMGETTLLAVGDNNRVLTQRRVRVTMNIADLKNALNALLPNNGINIEAVPNGIILTGRVNDPSAAEDARRVAARYVPAGGEIINRLRIDASNQIQLRVRVAEISRDVNKQFGINWTGLARIGGFQFGLLQGAAANSTGLFGLNSNRPAAFGETTNVLNFGNVSEDLNGFIDALAKDGLISILAEPSLTAMSGETAFFLAGGEFPILIPQGDGSVSIEFKDFGIKLSFTPTLINESRINLKVRPEVSELSTEGAVTLSSFVVPSLRVRRAETTVEVGTGQSFAIAGLISNSQNQSVKKFPILGDIPVLGPLFRSSAFQNDQSELVIIVTPYLVRPTGEQLALPTDGLAPPSEFDRLALMRETASDPNAKPMSGGPVAVAVKPRETVAAPVQTGGFIVE